MNKRSKHRNGTQISPGERQETSEDYSTDVHLGIFRVAFLTTTLICSRLLSTRLEHDEGGFTYWNQLIFQRIAPYSRNRLWNGEMGLWTDRVKNSPNKVRPYVDLGGAYFNAGAYGKSLETTQKAIQIDPKVGAADYNLDPTYPKMGDLNKAISMAKKSLDVDPTVQLPYDYPYSTLAHLNLGQIDWYEFQNRQKAVYRLKTAFMLDPLLPRRAEIRALVRFLEGLSSWSL